MGWLSNVVHDVENVVSDPAAAVSTAVKDAGKDIASSASNGLIHDYFIPTNLVTGELDKISGTKAFSVMAGFDQKALEGLGSANYLNSTAKAYGQALQHLNNGYPVPVKPIVKAPAGSNGGSGLSIQTPSPNVPPGGVGASPGAADNLNFVQRIINDIFPNTFK